MVSIPTLTVRSATVSFTYDVTETTSVTPDDGDRVRAAGQLADLQVQPVVLRGYVPRAKSTSASTETAGLRIEITVESEPLPDGLIRILELTDRTVSTPTTSQA
jgi:hypothetical protein